MKHYGKLFIDGVWVAPEAPGQKSLIDPFTEAAFVTVASGGGIADVEKAVKAARAVLASFSQTSPETS